MNHLTSTKLLLCFALGCVLTKLTTDSMKLLHYVLPMVGESKLRNTRIVKQYSLSIMTIFKEETDIMQEWLEHHLDQGVSHFYMIDNSFDDDHGDFMDVLLPFIQKHQVTLFHKSKKHAQEELMNEILSNVTIHSDWILSIDMDEFVFVRPESGYDNISSLLHNICCTCDQHVAIIFMKWTMFGSSGHLDQPSSVREGFTRCSGYGELDAKIGKYIVRSSDVDRWRVHNPRLKQTVHNPLFFDQCLQIIPDDIPAAHRHSYDDSLLCDHSTSPLVLNHYPIMSFKRFQDVKMTRGDVSQEKFENIRDATYFNNYDQIGNISDCTELAELVQIDSQLT